MVKVWGPGERRGAGRWRRAVVARHRERRLTRAAPPGGRASGRGAGLLFCAALGFLERPAPLLGGAVVLLALDARADQLGVDVVLGVRKLALAARGDGGRGRRAHWQVRRVAALCFCRICTFSALCDQKQYTNKLTAAGTPARARVRAWARRRRGRRADRVCVCHASERAHYLLVFIRTAPSARRRAV